MRVPTFVGDSSKLAPSDPDYLKAKLDLIVNTLGEKHLSWWEHKGSNQCRICDLIINCIRWEELYYSKSPLDSMNQSDFDFEMNCVLEQEPLPANCSPGETDV